MTCGIWNSAGSTPSIAQAGCAMFASDVDCAGSRLVEECVKEGVCETSLPWTQVEVRSSDDDDDDTDDEDQKMLVVRCP